MYVLYTKTVHSPPNIQLYQYPIFIQYFHQPQSANVHSTRQYPRIYTTMQIPLRTMAQTPTTPAYGGSSTNELQIPLFAAIVDAFCSSRWNFWLAADCRFGRLALITIFPI